MKILIADLEVEGNNIIIMKITEIIKYVFCENVIGNDGITIKLY